VFSAYIQMDFGLFMPPKIKTEHKYFDKFIQKLSIENLEPDMFSGQ